MNEVPHELQTDREQNELSSFPDIEMYRLPGDPPLEKKDLERYVTSNDKLVQSLSTIIPRGLADPDASIRMPAAGAISSAAEQKRTQFLEKALVDPHPEVFIIAAGAISSAPKEDQQQLRLSLSSLIENKLLDRTTDPYVREIAAEAIPFSSEEKRVQLFKTASIDPDPGVRAAGVKIIPFLPEQERTDSIKKALTDPSAYVFYAAAESISSAPEEDRQQLRSSLSSLIEKRLRDTDDSIAHEIITEAISFASGEDRKKREAASPNSGDEIQQVINSDPKRLEKLKKFAKTTPLYKDLEEKRFFQYGFSKTGSDILLLDIVPGSNEKSLKEKLIKRTIPLYDYLTWKKAYEASDVWKSLGFDYVPIEPIVSVHESNKLMQADVYARVLRGPSADTWLSESQGLYSEHIEDSFKKIEAGLTKLDVHHWHLRENNLVLVFERDEEGNPDLKKPPRVYAIDFDDASS